jgi:cytochrome c oxidase assembly protein subunit 15
MGNLINLNPALEVALLGAVLALVPVGIVAHRGRRQGLQGWAAWQRVLTVLALFLTLDLVVFGAFTRLTDSGLGCPDWPGCYGETSPFAAHSQISAAHEALPSGPVSHSKAWIEMVHRYLATAVGALITGLMVMAWVMRRRAVSLSPWWATGTFVWVCAQGAFGAFTVTLKLQPIIVTGHLIGAMLGVGLLTAQVRALGGGAGLASGCKAGAAWAASSLRRWGWGMLALLSVQIALGGWVSTNYAVLACTEVPMCQGQWWPEMDFATGFHLLRPLGGDGQGAFITLSALTAIHMVHRLFAVLVLIALIQYGSALRNWSPSGAKGHARPWRRDGAIMWALAAWQLASGLSNVVLGWPLAAALAHTLGAALLVWRLVHVLVTPRMVDQTASTNNDTSDRAAQPMLHEPRHHQGLHAGASRASASS